MGLTYDKVILHHIRRVPAEKDGLSLDAVKINSRNRICFVAFGRM